MLFGACTGGLRKSFISTSLESWHAWLSKELLIPNVFLWVNIDLTHVVYHKHTQSPEIWATQDGCLIFNLERLAQSHCVGFWLLFSPTVVPPDTTHVLRMLYTWKWCLWLLILHVLPLCSVWCFNFLEVRLKMIKGELSESGEVPSCFWWHGKSGQVCMCHVSDFVTSLGRSTWSCVFAFVLV